MSKAIQWIAVPALAIALLVGMDSPKAEAGNGFSVQIGGIGISSGRYNSFRPAYGATRGFGSPQLYGAQRYSPQRYSGQRSAYFGGGYGHTSHSGHRGYGGGTHLNYRAPSLVPYGNQYNYAPSRYDVRRTGDCRY